MPYDSNIDITLRGMQGGQICETQLEYHAELAVSGSYASLVANSVLNGIWLELQSCVTVAYTLLQILVTTTDNFAGGSVSESYVLDVNQSGSRVEEAMPPNVTVRLVKVVNNNTREPIAALPFRNGFAGFSGVSELDQANGILTPTASALWAQLAAEMLTIDILLDSTPYSWTLGLERGELSPDKVLADHVSVSQRLGTRNSRKR